MDNVQRPGIFRTYLYTRLLCPLEKDREYVFTASFRTPNNEALKHVDLGWFDFEPFHYQDRVGKAPEKNSITEANKIKDEQLGWKVYSIHFTATGEEQYVMIGNFAKEAFSGKTQMRSLIIYEIDNISLLPAYASFKACKERDENQQILYLHNNRHTPGKFLDDDQPPKQPEVHKDSVIPVTPPVTEPRVTPIPVVNDTLVIPDVLFKFDKSELNPVFAGRLDSLIDKIKNKTFKRIEVLGHTDSMGYDEYNKRLSLNRAITVKNYLITRLNYPADIIITKGFAATLPVTSNATGAGRQRNRRVEIVLIK